MITIISKLDYMERKRERKGEREINLEREAKIMERKIMVKLSDSLEVGWRRNQVWKLTMALTLEDDFWRLAASATKRLRHRAFRGTAILGRWRVGMADGQRR